MNNTDASTVRLHAPICWALSLLCILLLLLAACSADDGAADAVENITNDITDAVAPTPTAIVVTVPSDTATPAEADAPTAEPQRKATSTPATSNAETHNPETANVDASRFAPAPAPIGTVTYYTTTVTLPTYPYAAYQSDAVDPETGWPFKKFDRERYQTEQPAPEDRDYLALIVENVYLRMTILPELGGRIWQVEHKQSANAIFYQNAVVKPSPWGPGNQLGWLALGGLEWNLPVIEHGYDWGIEWGYLPNQHSPDLVTVTLFTPGGMARSINASITIALRSGAASFEIEPTLSNFSGDEIAFDYWHDAMLAPGPTNQPSDQLRFVLPSTTMIVHSTGDLTMPAPEEPFSWPRYKGRDLSRLGNWTQYLGFFETPAANGPFVGVYDETYDAGAVRVFPADIARGSKVFALGWKDALSSDYYTDDGTAYVELHGGLAPSFFAQYRLPPGGAVTWREVWYPVQGINSLTYANEIAALYLKKTGRRLMAGFYPTRPLDGALLVMVDGEEIARTVVDTDPETPFIGELATDLPPSGDIEVRFEDAAARLLLQYTLK